MSASEAADAPRRRGLGLAFDPRYRAFLSAQLLATVGQRIFEVVIALVVFEATRSTLMVGLASASQVAPQIVLGPLTGTIADRYGLLRHAVVGRVIAGAGALGLAAVLWLVPTTDPALGPTLIACCFVVGVGLTWSAPGTLAILPTIARPDELSAVVGLNALMPSLARMIGPALGVSLFVATGAPTTILLVGFTSLGFILLLWAARLPPIPVNRTAGSSSMDALRFALATPGTRAAFVTISSLGIATDVPVTLGPALADSLAGGAGYVGAFATGFGGGALASFLALGPLTRRWSSHVLMRVSLGLAAIGTLGAALAGTPTLVVAAFVVAGFGNALAMTSSTTALHEATPNELRGRVVALFMMSLMLGRISAAGINGLLADGVSVRAAMYFCVALLAVVVAYLFALGRRR